MNQINRYAAGFLTLLLTCFTSSLIAIDTQFFFEKELEVRPNLYKISAPELQDFLAQKFESTLAEVSTQSHSGGLTHQCHPLLGALPPDPDFIGVKIKLL